MATKKEEDVVLAYHYTDDDSAKGILETGTIRPSTTDGRDAAFGEAVYLTTKSPETHTTKEIAHNNYDDGKSFYLGKTEQTTRALEFEIPVGEVSKANSSRDVLMYENGDLSVDKYHTGKVYQSTDKGNYELKKN